MTEKKFQRTIESFVCEHCQAEVEGDGYTNHCPNCLYSKHVDNNPGDRASRCHGLMEPIAVLVTQAKYTIRYRCQLCGIVKNNKAAKNDSFESLLAIAKGSNHP